MMMLICTKVRTNSINKNKTKKINYTMLICPCLILNDPNQRLLCEWNPDKLL